MLRYILDFVKIIIAYFLSLIVIKYRNYWLICERGDDARDNGYWFFKYVMENYPNQKIVYCIDYNSVDYEKVKLIGKTIKTNSILHGVLFFSSEMIISTHPFGGIPKWKMINFFVRKKIVKVKGKRIFLQHGITKDYIEGITAKNFETDLFICGAKPEYDYILNNYGFSDSVVKYTGFARFDELFNSMTLYDKSFENKYILLMPTWRQEMRNIDTLEEFKKTDYYKFYQSLLDNTELKILLDKYHYKIIFYPHYEIQKWITAFNRSNEDIIIASFDSYDVQTLLINCDILITDYSSVFFDVAYMRKPILYYQFDYEKYRTNHYQEGYFDYTNSFGPVVKNEVELLSHLQMIIEKGIDNRFKKNINEFFIYNDNKNCERIYQAIKEVKKG